MKAMAMTLLALALAGCSLAPKYERPAAPVPQAYDTPAADGQAAMPQDWRDYFNDPALQAWIAAALENNRDLRVAATTSCPWSTAALANSTIRIAFLAVSPTMVSRPTWK